VCRGVTRGTTTAGVFIRGSLNAVDSCTQRGADVSVRRRSLRGAHATDGSNSAFTQGVVTDRPHVGFLCGSDDRDAAAWFRETVNANVVGIGYGIERRVIDANAAFLGAIGATAVDLRAGISLAALFDSDDALIDTFLRGGAREYSITRVDGDRAHVIASAIHRDGQHGWLVVTIDLTERKAAERAIEHLALHDPTTGVPNRRLLIDRLEQALARARRQRSITGVLFCDIDKFKHINDTYGHRAGDTALQTAALRLESILREGDTVARVGGDEFVILLERLLDPTDATRLAERARIAINEPIEIDDHSVQITASVGVALTSGLDDADALLRRADDAMYLAKARGRDQVALDPQDFPRSTADR
jgi:diguanylate cyclase (GGDEF)-like protein